MWRFEDFMGLELEIMGKLCSHSYFYLVLLPLANRVFKYSGCPSLNNFISNSPPRRALPRPYSHHGGIQFSTVMMLPEET